MPTRQASACHDTARSALAAAALGLAIPRCARPGRRANAGRCKLIVPFTPGTGIDLIARTVGPATGPAAEPARWWSTTAPAPPATSAPRRWCARRADGNTLLVSVNTLVMNRSLYPQLPFDPVKDLVPVSLTSWGQLLLVTPPAHRLQDRAATWSPRAKAQARQAQLREPRRRHAAPHVDGAVQGRPTGVYLTHIPYRGTAPAVTDLLGGQVDAMFLPIHVALPHMKAGRLVALGIGSDKRHPLLPHVPTLKEANAGDVNVDMWYGIFAPPGTPADQVQKLNHELKDILATPEVRTAFQTQGMDPATSSPEEFRRLVTRDAERWAALIRAAHIKAE